MGDAFTSQGTTDRPHPQPERQGIGRPSWPQEAPTLQTDSLVLTSSPQRERVYSVPLVKTGPAVGSQDPLLCWLAVLCRHEPPRDLHQLLPGSQARHGWEGWVQGAARLGEGSLYGDRLRLVGSKLGERHRAACAFPPVERAEGNPLPGSPGNTGPGSLPPQGLHVCLSCLGAPASKSCGAIVDGGKATPVS